MRTVLLDSNIIFDAINVRANRLVQLEALVKSGVSLACTSINITEVFMGMRPIEERLTVQFLDSLDYHPITPSVARLAGELYATWRKKGQTLSLPDLSIAALCIEKGLWLFTENKKHFPMPELNLYTPGS